ncbi:MAG: preprotein translocase subunit SecA [Candidatus Neptunochlamydia sp.]|nr:preprotein translocase subunit SecA [Candidatus Neptunochlamydia sp.]
MFGLIKKIFGTAQSRQVKRYQKIVKKINLIEEGYQSLTDDEVKGKVLEFKERLKNEEIVDTLLPEAYALVKNTCRRLCGTRIHVSGYDQEWDMVPYDVQLIGAIAMHYGSIAEMMTGEGKTLTASMPLFLHALTEQPVHLVTVNDYLANRDSEWIGEIFRWLGFTVKALTNSIHPHERKEIYKADIVYGTASEFGFDYLRDNSTAHAIEEQCQRGYYFAIIDEVDSILIDEARTPLIISGPATQSRQMYDELKDSVSRVVRLQRDHCNKLASDARKTLEKLGRISEDVEKRKLSKEETKEEEEAFRNLWLVGKGTPQNKLLKRIKEHPDLRAELEKWETYFHAEPNKDERHETLAELYIIIDERANEFELTDKGIASWTEGNQEAEDDFLMLDLGGEYAKIDENPSLAEKEKMEKKIALREEDSRRKERSHNLRQLFRAHLLMEKDIHYIVQDRKIVIIDENTGRPQPGRRFSDGLHQSIEAKESVPIQEETQTYATITLQNYFRMYDKLAGMTGTAMTEANELKEIYKIEVLEIPTHKKCLRKDADDEIYMSEREKYNALIKDIIEIHEQGRPILIGTESVEVSEKLARILKQNKLKATILNAKNHAKEAEIIALAGQLGSITVATNMAGRGTDIKLGEGIAETGGLHVIGTTRHQSRRIDRQLRGRCARQGDPGTSKFYVSFEDRLMRLFTSPKLTAFLQRFRPPEGEPISAKVLNRSIETAQKRVEQRNYSIRKHTLQYDDVMNKQRQEVYTFRNGILKEKESIKLAEDVLEEISGYLAAPFFTSKAVEDGWNSHEFAEALMTHFPITVDKNAFDDDYLSIEEIEKKGAQLIIDALKAKLDHEAQTIASIQENAGKEIDPFPVLHQVVRSILLKNIDKLWQEHLLSIDHLRIEVNMRVVGQKDPLLEFKHEAFALFDTFSSDLKLAIAHDLFKFQTMPPLDQQNLLHNLQQKHPSGLFLPNRSIQG